MTMTISQGYCLCYNQVETNKAGEWPKLLIWQGK